jgi:hypothetical protein
MVVAIARRKLLRVDRPKEVRVTAVDWLELELAFRDSTGTESYLDTRSGEVVAVVPGFSDEADLRQRIAEDPDRFAQIEPVDTSYSRAVMRSFIHDVATGELKARLEEAESAQFGGLKRCLDVLGEESGALNKYHRFEQSRLWSHIEAFLDAQGVTADSRPPSVELFEGAGRTG